MQLLQGNCLELMKDIPDGSVDMILCDLPYGTTRNKWDSVIDLGRMWEQYRRITKENSAIVLFSAEPFTSALIVSNLSMFRYDLIWAKPSGSDFLNANRKPLRAHENICVFYRKLPTYNKQMRPGNPYKIKNHTKSNNYGSYQTGYVTQSKGGRYPLTVLNFSHDRNTHPTQKPVPLLEYLIKTYTDPGQVVLDNCMGSGSTGVACVNTGRDFIGIELDPSYFEIAKDRIEKQIADKASA